MKKLDIVDILPRRRRVIASANFAGYQTESDLSVPPSKTYSLVRQCLMPPSDLATAQGKGSVQARASSTASTTSSTTSTTTTTPTTLGTLAKCCAQILTQSFASKRDSNNGQTNEKGHGTQKMLPREKVEEEKEEEGTQQEPIQTCWQTFTRATHREHATISLFGVCRVRQKCDRHHRSWRRHRTRPSRNWNWSSKELTALFRNGLKRVITRFTNRFDCTPVWVYSSIQICALS